MKYIVKLTDNCNLPSIVRNGVPITHAGVELEKHQVTANMRAHPHIEIVELPEKTAEADKAAAEARKEEEGPEKAEKTGRRGGRAREEAAEAPESEVPGDE